MGYADFLRWGYKGKRPNALIKLMNRLTLPMSSSGRSPDYFITLEVLGRKSGQAIQLPLVLVIRGPERFLVSMLGDNVQWIRNVEANAQQAVIIKGGREAVRLERVPVVERAPIIRAYLKIAPGARPHIPVDKDAPLKEFERIAVDYPVFRVLDSTTPASLPTKA